MVGALDHLQIPVFLQGFSRRQNLDNTSVSYHNSMIVKDYTGRHYGDDPAGHKDAVGSGHRYSGCLWEAGRRGLVGDNASLSGRAKQRCFEPRKPAGKYRFKQVIFSPFTVLFRSAVCYHTAFIFNACTVSKTVADRTLINTIKTLRREGAVNLFCGSSPEEESTSQ